MKYCDVNVQSKKAAAMLLAVFLLVCSQYVTVSSAGVHHKEATSDLRICDTMMDFKYVYTECDNEGGRWRVSVPKHTLCTAGISQPPIRGKDCDFTCGPGEYLDINTDQDCVKCPAGKFSLGGGVLFNAWKEMPVGFEASLQSFIQSGENTTCAEAGWSAQDKYLSASYTECIAMLIYTANLVKPGRVVFEYQHVGDSSMFTVEVRNTQCESDKDPAFLNVTDRGVWKTYHQTLKSGFNTIIWRFYSYSSVSKKRAEDTGARIKTIEITGVAYTSECSQCEAGTYSEVGASKCTPCPANTYSSLGSSTCTPCDPDSEYSDVGSSSCSQRPMCTAEHYFVYHAPCINGQTRKQFAWIEPRLCIDGVSLPPAGKPEPCPPCNAGMQLVNGTCEFCAHNQFSDGIGSCKDCPGSTYPNIGLVYKQWSHMHESANVTSFCMSLTDGTKGCRSHKGWVAATDYVQTLSSNADDVYLVMSINVNGFRGGEDYHWMTDGTEDGIEETDGTEDGIEENDANDDYKEERYGTKYWESDGDVLLSDRDFYSTTFSEISFIFETHCTAECKFLFLKQSDRDLTELVHFWTGKQNRTIFRMKLTSPVPVKLSWAFQKSSADSDDGMKFDFVDDWARIYLINITNTLSGGAATCIHCPRGAGQHGCIPCNAGEYIDPDTEQCTACPANTVVSSTSSWGRESCMACGDGLTAYRSRSCVSNCTFVDSNQRIRDFSQLPSIHLVSGPMLFTTTGHAYQHVFNISLCGGVDERSLALCSDNASTPHNVHRDSTSDVLSHVCQSTLLLSDRRTKSVLAIDPVGLGDKLVRVTDRADKNITAMLSAAGLEPAVNEADNSSLDVYMLYSSDYRTDACKHGRQVLAVLRCDKTHSDAPGSFESAPGCVDGTCDGCDYVFVLKTIAACPVCTIDDFRNLTSACVGGKKQIATSMNGVCNRANVKGLPAKDQTKIVVDCWLLWEDEWPIWLKVIVISVPAIVFGGVMLLTIVVYCWLKNRSLNYKYMKLVESSNSRGQYGGVSGELPAAETCALDEGEEDDDEHFGATQIRKPKLFGKFGKSSDHNKEDDETFESMRMSQKSLLA